MYKTMCTRTSQELTNQTLKNEKYVKQRGISWPPFEVRDMDIEVWAHLSCHIGKLLLFIHPSLQIGANNLIFLVSSHCPHTPQNSVPLKVHDSHWSISSSTLELAVDTDKSRWGLWTCTLNTSIQSPAIAFTTSLLMIACKFRSR